MVSLNFWSSDKGSKAIGGSPQDTQRKDQSPQPAEVDDHSTSQTAVGAPSTGVVVPAEVSKNTDVSIPATVPELAPKTSVPTPPARRSFKFFHSRAEHKPMLTSEQEGKKERQVAQDLKHAVLSHASSSKSDKRAKESAEIVRSLIVGPNSITPISKKTKPLSKAQLDKVKSDLAKPKSANKVIARLRQLDLDPDSSSSKPFAQLRANGPIHAVCLDVPDEEASQRHFARLTVDPSPAVNRGAEVYPSVVTASVESVTSMFNDLNVVNLLSSDFGIGSSIDGSGILSGAVPTAETVINGIMTFTPQLMSLGYATGQALYPDHKGIHPPTDRLSVLTYWWGLEVVLPPPTLKYLDNGTSISHTVLNFLTALAAVNNGVREILPFVRYISQFIEFEFSTIKSQNRGRGVVCAATWIMPAALVPRPWDFDPPANSLPTTEPENEDPATSEPDSTQPSDDSKPTTPRVDDSSPFMMIQPLKPPVASDSAPSDINVTRLPGVTVV